MRGTQYSLLSQIVVNGPLRAGELAQRMRLDNSTLTRTLTTLERPGWIARHRDIDGRSRLIAATVAGTPGAARHSATGNRPSEPSMPTSARPRWSGCTPCSIP